MLLSQLHRSGSYIHHCNIGKYMPCSGEIMHILHAVLWLAMHEWRKTVLLDVIYLQWCNDWRLAVGCSLDSTLNPSSVVSLLSWAEKGILTVAIYVYYLLCSGACQFTISIPLQWLCKLESRWFLLRSPTYTQGISSSETTSCSLSY